MPSSINTDFYSNCIATLDLAWRSLAASSPNQLEHNLYRSACVKEFEIILEQSGQLLKKRLNPYFAHRGQIAALSFNDVFRHAGKHGLLSAECVERWIAYRQARNTTAHEYGEQLASDLIKLVPAFLQDAEHLRTVISSLEQQSNDTSS